jgi:SAM-dependent methyltransferase
MSRALAFPVLSAHRRRETCRACSGRELELVLSLGQSALANAFLRSPDEFASEARYPLELFVCRTCGLAQLLDVVPAEALFSNYVYVTGTSDTIAEHNAAYARTVVELLALSASDLVVELASNDGSLLRQFQSLGVRVLGVEPASNIAERARESGVETVDFFFDRAAGARLAKDYGAAKVVIGNNVLAHVDDTLGFLCGARDLLAPGGLAIFEVPYVREFVERLEYDTIYHEHLCYFSITALMRLFAAAGLSIVRVDEVSVHGGSVRVYASVLPRSVEHGFDAQRLAAREREERLTEVERFHRFARDVERTRAELLTLLHELRNSGKKVAAYGAPAKGNTLLQYCAIGPELVPYTVDKSPYKVGLFTPGMHLPVLPAATLLERQPDCTLVLAWNFADEIRRQQAEYARRGGRFLLPLPHPRMAP